MANDLSRAPQLSDGDLDNYQAPEVVYCLEDLNNALAFLAELDHQEGSPWGYLAEQAIVVLQKLTVIRQYLVNPSDQQHIGAHSLHENFFHILRDGIKIGGKKISTAADLDAVTFDLASMLEIPLPKVEIPSSIRDVIFPKEDKMVIDDNDKF